ncbi:MAG: hypothetical protein P8X63_08130 [Desulfuromonadaceae bacterium]
MQEFSSWQIGFLLCCAFLFLPVLVWGESVFIYLSVEDCQKCHVREFEDIAQRGGKHKTAVTCLDCHLDHPPRGTRAIPQCSMCHLPADSAHFRADHCSGCHPPHRPLDIAFAGMGLTTPACVSCHPHQGRQVADYPSSHTLLDCKECHPRHGQFLKCQDCHQPHVDEMTYEDCLSCHQPHQPLRITYDSYVPSRFCAGCHPVELDLLELNQTKHHDLLCVYCHKSQHKQIPLCVTCHGLIHSKEIHDRFPNCNTCHAGPHTLVR